MSNSEFEKQVIKALKHSGSFLLELEECYAAEWIPLHLQILLNQCAFGLLHYGYSQSEVLESLDRELTRVKNALEVEKQSNCH